MIQDNNPLSSLMLKESLNKDILASILKNFIKISPENGEIILLPDYAKLRNKEQVIIVILAFKAVYELGLRKNEVVSPKEIEQTSQLVGSTVRGILRDLIIERKLKYENGKYEIPNFLLFTLKDRFENLDLENQIKGRKGTIKRVSKSRKDFSRIKSILDADPKFFNKFYHFLVDTRGKYLEKSLLILKIVKDNFEIDGLTPSEISEILRNKIRVPRLHQSNVSLYLGDSKNSKYVFRDSFKNGYIYKLTRPGENFVNNIK